MCMRHPRHGQQEAFSIARKGRLFALVTPARSEVGTPTDNAPCRIVSFIVASFFKNCVKNFQQLCQPTRNVRYGSYRHEDDQSFPI